MTKRKTKPAIKAPAKRSKPAKRRTPGKVASRKPIAPAIVAAPKAWTIGYLDGKPERTIHGATLAEALRDARGDVGFGAFLAHQDLRNADLRGVRLIKANLECCNLRNAKLGVITRADLTGADLTGAEVSMLWGVNLAHANLSGVDLSKAGLANANFRGVAEVISPGHPNNFTTVAFRHNGMLLVRAGCRCFTLSEALTYWSGKEHRRELYAACLYIEAVAKARGWL